MTSLDLLLHAERAVIDGQVREVVLPPGSVLLPGLVDTHVHVNEPGTDWEGFASATAAAAAGGITTLVDMPLDSDPVTTSVASLEHKHAAAQGNCRVDVGFWGGAVPGNLDELAALLAAGCLGFKCFLSDSGNPLFPPLPPAQFGEAAARCAELGAVLLVHAESAEVIAGTAAAQGESYASFLNSRPDRAEVQAVELVLDEARRSGARMHIVHVSSADTLPLLAEAKRQGLRITDETCPHYLSFDAEDVPDGGTEFAACPPIRGGDNREQLWAALRDGVLDMIVSDHSPCAPALKGNDFGTVFGGISSLQLGLQAVWTQARHRGADLIDVCRWMAQRPAELAGLTDRGRIAVGAAADFVVFDPDARARVEATQLRHRHPLTPYDGRELTGAVLQTWLAGQPVSERDSRGRLLRSAVPA